MLIPARVAALLVAAFLVQPAASDPPPLDLFFDAASLDDAEAEAALARLGAAWRDGYAALLIDIARFTRPREEARSVDVSDVTPKADPQGLTAMPSYPGARFATAEGREHASTRVRARLVRFLQRHTGRRFGDDLDRWRTWSWRLPYDPHPEYLAFKADLYTRVSPAVAALFVPGTSAGVRLDELEWTGLGAGDLPPLVVPPAVPMSEGRHVRDGHRVAGVQVNGAARAYPLRLLAPHQLVLDRLGGRDVLVAHCPIGGITAAYDVSGAPGHARYGGSGLVHRSQSLFFDSATRGLWSVLTGEQLIGAADFVGTTLAAIPVEVTSWRDWRAAVPGSEVMADDVGGAARYVEGAFTPARLRRVGLAFPLPHESRALPRDAEIVGVRPAPGDPTSVAAAFAVTLRDPFRVVRLGARQVVAVRTRAGSLRVYDLGDAARGSDAGETRFVSRGADGRLQDDRGRYWRAEADALVEDGAGTRAPRVATVHASWGAWYSQYPETVLVR